MRAHTHTQHQTHLTHSSSGITAHAAHPQRVHPSHTGRQQITANHNTFIYLMAVPPVAWCSQEQHPAAPATPTHTYTAAARRHSHEQSKILRPAGANTHTTLQGAAATNNGLHPAHYRLDKTRPPLHPCASGSQHTHTLQKLPTYKWTSSCYTRPQSHHTCTDARALEPLHTHQRSIHTTRKKKRHEQKKRAQRKPNHLKPLQTVHTKIPPHDPIPPRLQWLAAACCTPPDPAIGAQKLPFQ